MSRTGSMGDEMSEVVTAATRKIIIAFSDMMLTLRP
jgi:hypothetical protein